LICILTNGTNFWQIGNNVGSSLHTFYVIHAIQSQQWQCFEGMTHVAMTLNNEMDPERNSSNAV
jgi:hypothetical protein